MHAKKFAPKNAPSSASAALDQDGEVPVASSSKTVPSAPIANKKKRKKGDTAFKTGTEGEGPANLSDLMNNFKKATLPHAFRC